MPGGELIELFEKKKEEQELEVESRERELENEEQQELAQVLSEVSSEAALPFSIDEEVQSPKREVSGVVQERVAFFESLIKAQSGEIESDIPLTIPKDVNEVDSDVIGEDDSFGIRELMREESDIVQEEIRGEIDVDKEEIRGEVDVVKEEIREDVDVEPQQIVVAQQDELDRDDVSLESQEVPKTEPEIVREEEHVEPQIEAERVNEVVLEPKSLSVRLMSAAEFEEITSMSLFGKLSVSPTMMRIEKMLNTYELYREPKSKNVKQIAISMLDYIENICTAWISKHESRDKGRDVRRREAVLLVLKQLSYERSYLDSKDEAGLTARKMFTKGQFEGISRFLLSAMINESVSGIAVIGETLSDKLTRRSAEMKKLSDLLLEYIKYKDSEKLEEMKIGVNVLEYIIEIISEILPKNTGDIHRDYKGAVLSELNNSAYEEFARLSEKIEEIEQSEDTYQDTSVFNYEDYEKRFIIGDSNAVTRFGKGIIRFFAKDKEYRKNLDLIREEMKKYSENPKPRNANERNEQIIQLEKVYDSIDVLMKRKDLTNEVLVEVLWVKDFVENALKNISKEGFNEALLTKQDKKAFGEDYENKFLADDSYAITKMGKGILRFFTKDKEYRNNIDFVRDEMRKYSLKPHPRDEKEKNEQVALLKKVQDSIAVLVNHKDVKDEVLAEVLWVKDFVEKALQKVEGYSFNDTLLTEDDTKAFIKNKKNVNMSLMFSAIRQYESISNPRTEMERDMAILILGQIKMYGTNFLNENLVRPYDEETSEKVDLVNKYIGNADNESVRLSQLDLSATANKLTMSKGDLLALVTSTSYSMDSLLEKIAGLLELYSNNKGDHNSSFQHMSISILDSLVYNCNLWLSKNIADMNPEKGNQDIRLVIINVSSLLNYAEKEKKRIQDKLDSGVNVGEYELSMDMTNKILERTGKLSAIKHMFVSSALDSVDLWIKSYGSMDKALREITTTIETLDAEKLEALSGEKRSALGEEKENIEAYQKFMLKEIVNSLHYWLVKHKASEIDSQHQIGKETEDTIRLKTKKSFVLSLLEIASKKLSKLDSSFDGPMGKNKLISVHQVRLLQSEEDTYSKSEKDSKEIVDKDYQKFSELLDSFNLRYRSPKEQTEKIIALAALNKLKVLLESIKGKIGIQLSDVMSEQIETEIARIHSIEFAEESDLQENKRSGLGIKARDFDSLKLIYDLDIEDAVLSKIYGAVTIVETINKEIGIYDVGILQDENANSLLQLELSKTVSIDTQKTNMLIIAYEQLKNLATIWLEKHNGEAESDIYKIIDTIDKRSQVLIGELSEILRVSDGVPDIEREEREAIGGSNPDMLDFTKTGLGEWTKGEGRKVLSEPVLAVLEGYNEYPRNLKEKTVSVNTIKTLIEVTRFDIKANIYDKAVAAQTIYVKQLFIKALQKELDRVQSMRIDDSFSKAELNALDYKEKKKINAFELLNEIITLYDKEYKNPKNQEQKVKGQIYLEQARATINEYLKKNASSAYEERLNNYKVEIEKELRYISLLDFGNQDALMNKANIEGFTDHKNSEWKKDEVYSYILELMSRYDEVRNKKGVVDNRVKFNILLQVVHQCTLWLSKNEETSEYIKIVIKSLKAQSEQTIRVLVNEVRENKDITQVGSESFKNISNRGILKVRGSITSKIDFYLERFEKYDKEESSIIEKQLALSCSEKILEECNAWHLKHLEDKDTSIINRRAGVEALRTEHIEAVKRLKIDIAELETKENPDYTLVSADNFYDLVNFGKTDFFSGQIKEIVQLLREYEKLKGQNDNYGILSVLELISMNCEKVISNKEDEKKLVFVNVLKSFCNKEKAVYLEKTKNDQQNVKGSDKTNIMSLSDFQEYTYEFSSRRGEDLGKIDSCINEFNQVAHPVSKEQKRIALEKLEELKATSQAWFDKKKDEGNDRVNTKIIVNKLINYIIPLEKSRIELLNDTDLADGIDTGLSFEDFKKATDTGKLTKRSTDDQFALLDILFEKYDKYKNPKNRMQHEIALEIISEIKENANEYINDSQLASSGGWKFWKKTEDRQKKLREYMKKIELEEAKLNSLRFEEQGSPFVEFKDAFADLTNVNEGTVTHQRYDIFDRIDSLFEKYLSLNKSENAEELQSRINTLEVMDNLCDKFLNIASKSKSKRKKHNVIYINKLKGYIATEKALQETKIEALADIHAERVHKYKKDKEPVYRDSLKGSMSSCLTSLAAVIKALVGSPGAIANFNVHLEVPIPVDNTGTNNILLGFDFTSIMKRPKESSYRADTQITLLAGIQLAKVFNIKANIGFFLNVVASTPEKLMNLVSYGIYRSFRESRVLPEFVTNKMWGNNVGETGARMSEFWASAVEKDIFGDDDNSFVELGETISGSAGLKTSSDSIGDFSLEAMAGLRLGTRYNKKSIEKFKLKGGSLEQIDLEDLTNLGTMNKKKNQGAKMISLSTMLSGKTPIVSGSGNANIVFLNMGNSGFKKNHYAFDKFRFEGDIDISTKLGAKAGGDLIYNQAMKWVKGILPAIMTSVENKCKGQKVDKVALGLAIGKATPLNAYKSIDLGINYEDKVKKLKEQQLQPKTDDLAKFESGGALGFKYTLEINSDGNVSWALEGYTKSSYGINLGDVFKISLKQGSRFFHMGSL